MHTPDFLNTIVASRLPNHKLRLKVGVSVMFLRNLDIQNGLFNGTRLIITTMRKYVLRVHEVLNVEVRITTRLVRSLK